MSYPLTKITHQLIILTEKKIFPAKRSTFFFFFQEMEDLLYESGFTLILHTVFFLFVFSMLVHSVTLSGLTDDKLCAQTNRWSPPRYNTVTCLFCVRKSTMCSDVLSTSLTAKWRAVSPCSCHDLTKNIRKMKTLWTNSLNAYQQIQKPHPAWYDITQH